MVSMHIHLLNDEGITEFFFPQGPAALLICMALLRIVFTHVFIQETFWSLTMC